VSVTQPAISGPFSCFDASRGGPERRALEVYLGDDVVDGGGGSGYLSSAITDLTGAGSAGCPWLLRASPWQRINVTLIDFSDAASRDARPDAFGYSIVLGEREPYRRHDIDELRSAADVDRPDDHRHQEPIDVDVQRHEDSDGNALQELHLRTFCDKYAVVRERQSSSSRETVVCGDKARQKVVYLSAGNEIEVELVRTTSTNADDVKDETSAKQPAVFLLRYDSEHFTLLLSFAVNRSSEVEVEDRTFV